MVSGGQHSNSAVQTRASIPPQTKEACLMPANTGGPQDHPWPPWFAGRTQHVVILTAMIYCSKRVQGKSSVGRGPKQTGAKVLSQQSHVKWRESCSVVSDSLRPYGLHSPWNSLGQDTGVGSLSLLQGIFPTQGSNPGLPHCRRLLYKLSHQGRSHCFPSTGDTVCMSSARETQQPSARSVQWRLIV